MTQTEPEVQIARADRRSNMRAAVVVVVAAGAVVLFVVYGIPWVDEWSREAVVAGNTGARLLPCFVAGIITGLLGFATTLSGAHVLRISLQTRQHRQLPPPGLRLFLDVRVVRGPPGVALGLLFAILGVLILICAAILVALGSYVTFSLWP